MKNKPLSTIQKKLAPHVLGLQHWLATAHIPLQLPHAPPTALAGTPPPPSSLISINTLSVRRSYVGEPAGFDSGGEALPASAPRILCFLDEQRVLESMAVAASADVGSYCWLLLGRSCVGRAACRLCQWRWSASAPRILCFWMNRESWRPWSLLLLLMLALIVGCPLAGVMSGNLQALIVEVERFRPPDPLFFGPTESLGVHGRCC